MRLLKFLIMGRNENNPRAIQGTIVPLLLHKGK